MFSGENAVPSAVGTKSAKRRWLVRAGGAVVVLGLGIATTFGDTSRVPVAPAPHPAPALPTTPPITPAVPLFLPNVPTVPTATPGANMPPAPLPMLPSVVVDPELQPVAKPEIKPVVPPAIQPIAKPEIRPVPQPEVKPIAKPEIRPMAPPEIKPAAFRQPDPKDGKDAKAPLPLPLPPPSPAPGPFGDDKVRLPRMGGPPLLGETPVPTPQQLEEEKRFIDGVIDPRNTFDLVEGRARLVNLKQPPIRTQIADPTVASFRIIEPKGTQMTIIGAKAGTTVLNLWFTDPKEKDKEVVLSYLVRVFPDPEAKARLEAVYKLLEIEINKAFPQSRVRLTLVGDKLMISGQAHDIYEATQLLRLARANAPGSPANRAPTTSLPPTGQPLDPLRPIDTPGLESFQTAGGPNVINNLRVPGEQQVQLRVVVAEVNRAAARTIGLNFSITNNRGVQVFAQTTGGLLAAGGVGAGAAGAGGNLPVNLDNGQIPIAIQALRTLNYARSLAEPNLVAMNGQTATFLAGGQFPVPVLGGFGALNNNAGGGGTGGLQGVQFVPFGVQLAFSPIITDRDRIRLTVTATVSTRDNSASANIGGTNVPGLNTRTFSTTVELREGQTMAVAGLIQNNIGATASRVPFFGDLPYVGRFASLQQTSQGEQELIVLVTPELVHPLEPHELSALPGADVFEPGDMEFYLAGRLESRRSYDYRSSVMTDIHRMLRYRKCEQVYIVGPSGHTDPPPPAVPAIKK